MGRFVHSKRILSGALLGRREDLSVAGISQSARAEVSTYSLSTGAFLYPLNIKPGQQDDDITQCHRAGCASCRLEALSQPESTLNSLHC